MKQLQTNDCCDPTEQPAQSIPFALAGHNLAHAEFPAPQQGVVQPCFHVTPGARTDGGAARVT